MKDAVVLSHVAFEDLGLLAPLLQEAGWTLSRREAAIDDLTAPELEAAGLVVVLGGPIGAYESETYPFLTAETRLLEKRLRADKPVLGICLGCQLMAQALGGRVYFGGKKEIGFGSVRLTGEGEASALAPLAASDAAVLHWHGDTFEIPAGAVRLAESAVYPNQAFSFGKALALQFHLEAEPRRLENWFVGHACELSAAGISIPALRAEAARLRPVLERQAKQVFAHWLAGI
jgi:GMP synthase (glutamine-hydrolysing)